MGNKGIKEFKEKKDIIKDSKEDLKKQHDKGKLTARERLDLLLDKDSFVELDAFSTLKSLGFLLN